MSLHFPLPKICTFRFSLHTSRPSLLKWLPFLRWNSQWVQTFRCQKFRPLCSNSLKWREPRDEWSKTQDKGSNPAAPSHIVLPIEKMNQRGSGWYTLPEKIYRSQSTKKSAELNERLPDLCIAICRFSQVRFIAPSHLTHNLFSISNSFWYYFFSSLLQSDARPREPSSNSKRTILHRTDSYIFN